jgi:tRNA(fMet)-specific endonuclease VapC
MTILDADHLSVHAFPNHAQFANLAQKIRNSDDEFGTTIVCIEEQLRGWLAAIRGKPNVHDQIRAYNRLARLWDYFRDWTILRFDDRAADQFKTLRKQKIRIGSQDLKIASSALTQDALLLSANLRDFRQIPRLRVENWLEV